MVDPTGESAYLRTTMKRRRLYIIYLGLWLLTAYILLSGAPKELAHHWAVRGSLALPLLVIYGLPIFLLYLFSAFLFDFRGETAGKDQLLTFLKRRRLPIAGFLFCLAVLVLLILKSLPS
ncbi:MAG TPA: hypothetical protein PK175_01700 [Syntrophales bacterium]|jgi:hypothetical protein|nr:hypothetical protein [Syntrophales bacterium]HOU76789.1 hypothetical protein [Syntrophales bacterium]HQG33574.1 hypothetical protein [Syntrophales bacterium]HQI34747.1 hypothetical protein [Syntrophales bacterium]HQJ30794.1 hypothetical protein [Syntrophales bacterium]